MKYRSILIEQLRLLPWFDKTAILQLGEQHDIKTSTIDAYIKQSLMRKDLLQLKKGTYVTADFFLKNKNDIAYTFYLANILRQPSYVSSWTALQYYNLVTEAIYTIISITPKITRSYNNKAGNFAYQSIKKEFFNGFSLVQGTFDFFIASPSKALFDLLYLKTNQFRSVHFEELQILVDDLRIDIDEMEAEEKKIFYSLTKEHYKQNG